VLDSTPSTTQSQPRTPSPSCEPRCESCSEPSTKPQVPSHNRCGQPSRVTTTTPAPASRVRLGRPAAQEALVDDLVRDCLAALEALEDNELSAGCAEAAEIVAIVSGQDVEQGDDGVFRIARGVAETA